jgi:hypothetical protein
MSDKQVFILNSFLKEGNRLLMLITDKFGINHTIEGPQQEMRKLQLNADLEGHNKVIINNSMMTLTNDRLGSLTQS